MLFRSPPLCVLPYSVCEKAASETLSFSSTIFTWYQSLVHGKELKKANQVHSVLVRGLVLLSWEQIFAGSTAGKCKRALSQIETPFTVWQEGNICYGRGQSHFEAISRPVLEAEVLHMHSEKGPVFAV